MSAQVITKIDVTMPDEAGQTFKVDSASASLSDRFSDGAIFLVTLM